LKSELWLRVIQAIENSIPEYDAVNEKISFGHAKKARAYAARELSLKDGLVALDAGIGPGTMSEMLLGENSNVTIVGLDASPKLLQAARERFKKSRNAEIHYICATFEAVPVRDVSLDRIVSAYAFRDARDRDTAIEEFHRALRRGGCFAIVDLGKPDNVVKRVLVTTYIQHLMPLIANLSKSSRITGNPWRMIVPTYRLLSRNSELIKALKTKFSDVRLEEFLLGGAIVIIAQVD
jgi:ubiquinone/menaquinone biosynthesis C-methylase UbiE